MSILNITKIHAGMKGKNMKQVQNNYKKVHYVTYEYDDIAEKESHIVKMATDDYELLDRFEDAQKVTYRRIYYDEFE